MARSATAVPDGFRATATFSQPPARGHVIEPVSADAFDLARYGYTEHEYFAAGTATAFEATSAPSDGRWSIRPTSTATYRTRILVRIPEDARRFNGTVLVEWMNESFGESAPEWDFFNPELMAAGYAYVAVSAQAVGVAGGTPILGGSGDAGSGLVAADPARYGSLHHPGDQYSFDMFAQIGAALRAGGRLHVLGDLHPRRIAAVGESQSAYFLTTFVDALQPRTHTFDGFFIHSRGGAGAPLDGASITAPGHPGDLRIRTDADVPVFMFETQTDLIELGYARAQQPDTRWIRTWEVAGTAHADQYLVGPAVGLLGCTTPINNGPQHVVVQAALVAFNRWMAEGTPPPSPAPFRLAGTDPPRLALDRFGNVIGGVRTPAVDVPVSTLSGSPPQGASEVCALFGSTTPFSEQTLVDRYHDRAIYLAAFTASLDRAISAGYILRADAGELRAQADAVRFPA